MSKPTETNEKTVTRDINLIVTFDKYDNAPRLLISDHDFASSDEYTTIATKEVVFDIPDPEIINAAALGGLEAMRATMRAAASAAIQEVDDQIASLLAIGHDDGH